MKNIEELQKAYSAGERFKYLFFWGHTPKKDSMVDKSCFSQWWPSPFKVSGQTYSSAEHWMMAEKARLFKDEDCLEKILNAKTPAEAKKLGREIRNFDQNEWLANRFDIVVQGNRHKFEQYPDLLDFLRKTKDRVLVEASPRDSIWGIGLDEKHKDVENPLLWPGLNLLGFALMETRELLRKKT